MSLINILLVILNNSIFYWLLVIDRSITFAQSNPMGDNSRLREKLVAAALFTHISVPSFLSNLTPSRPFCPALGSILHRGTEWSVLAFWVVLATGAAVATGTFCCCLHVQPLPICHLHFYRKSRGFTFLVARYLQIQELLDRVADRDNHDLHQSQAHDTLHMEEDQFAMDFSDTLFSTLSQTNHTSNKDEFCKFACSVICGQ